MLDCSPSKEEGGEQVESYRHAEGMVGLVDG